MKKTSTFFVKLFKKFSFQNNNLYKFGVPIFENKADYQLAGFFLDGLTFPHLQSRTDESCNTTRVQNPKCEGFEVQTLNPLFTTKMHLRAKAQ
jgi:hypothetical protein